MEVMDGYVDIEDYKLVKEIFFLKPHYFCLLLMQAYLLPG